MSSEAGADVVACMISLAHSLDIRVVAEGVETETERRFTAEEVELVRGIGEQAAAALHNAKVYRELEQRQRETELLNEIARKITSTLRVEDIADATLVELRRLVPFDRASVVLVDEHGRLATILSSDSGWRYAGMDAGAVAAELAERLRTGQALMLDLPTDGPLPAGVGFLSVNCAPGKHSW